jgi:hypothetical protein
MPPSDLVLISLAWEMVKGVGPVQSLLLFLPDTEYWGRSPLQGHFQLVTK